MPESYLRIAVEQQQIRLALAGKTVFTAAVSTAKNGMGEKKDSGCTPRGQHIIRAMIGHNKPINTVFVGRRPTGEYYSSELARSYPDRDWILSRIIWLSGTERNYNRLGDVDTMQRYIYIHGSPDTCPMGEPLSHGCIRMHNDDVIQLFALCHPGMPVIIA
ncbi:MAG TPA: L,D-transpeptidase [Gammaproteobacteria bacterium]|nr:L,D-transpeptidase [Gammaproteobacteria bacterium]HAU07068.1 L,D-transpeptidase [Gammaproteobacteria bacterium]